MYLIIDWALFMAEIYCHLNMQLWQYGTLNIYKYMYNKYSIYKTKLLQYKFIINGKVKFSHQLLQLNKCYDQLWYLAMVFMFCYYLNQLSVTKSYLIVQQMTYCKTPNNHKQQITANESIRGYLLLAVIYNIFPMENQVDQWLLVALGYLMQRF